MTFLDQTISLPVDSESDLTDRRWRSDTAASASRAPKRLSLALQGGGALGAFTWGVLDRLLEEDIAFDAVSGSSAGAMNAVLLASGMAKGGRNEARASLDRFWNKVSDVGRAARSPWNSVTLHAITSKLSPYQFNPLDLSPLRKILAEQVDVEAVRNGPVRLLLGTTHVTDGELRIFNREELTIDVLLASACLPHASQAVSIGGEAYWDGGYAANPPLLPLVNTTKTSDLLIVEIIPSHSSEIPKTRTDIDKRLNQMLFSSSLHKDLEALSMMTELSRAEDESPHSPLGRKLQDLRLHRISAEDHVAALSEAAFDNTDRSFFGHLRGHGRAAADAWLQEASRAPAMARAA